MEITLQDHKTERWRAVLPTLLILIIIVILNSSVNIHGQLLILGENIWDGYFHIRHDPIEPNCNPNIDIESELSRLAYNHSANSLDDIDLFGPSEFDEETTRKSLESASAICHQKFQNFEDTSSRITSAVIFFRTIEIGVSRIGELGITIQRALLASLIIFCCLNALLNYHHIAFRPIESRLDHKVASGGQLIAMSLLFISLYTYKHIATAAKVEILPEQYLINHLWIFGFGAGILISLYQFLFTPKHLPEGNNFTKATLSIPLYASMAIIVSGYFFVKGHFSALAIYLNQMMDLSQSFLNLALYVWVGMLLKRTILVEKVFDIFRPLKLPPEMLAVAIVAFAAIPTAYTGASGIFIIAAGGLIYQELRRTNTRRQLALAATAMSGSLGVVIRPCLLVIVVAALNKEVTTDQLFNWGVKIFFATTVIFALYALITRPKNETRNFEKVEWSEFRQALLELLPYVLLITVILFIYSTLLNAHLDEFSAPIILPVIMFAVLIYERIKQEKFSREMLNIDAVEQRTKESWNNVKKGKDSIERSIREGTYETTGHIGALLTLMALTFSMGGLIERVELLALVPAEFPSLWATMGILVVILVLIGMIMEPFGAVILVTSTIAVIAYNNGIHPVHFWMTTLVAFELGYLSPPVALNHLLSRQVVGEEEVRLAKLEGHSFWYRHEKILLPLITMGTVLLMVAFIPLIVGYQ